jgi:hypothetical protein
MPAIQEITAITCTALTHVVEIGALACCALMKEEGYFAPEPTRESFTRKLDEQYRAENFDPVLGWIPRRSEREANGARISPKNPA